MAVKLGYGGIANTNGARDFSGKALEVSGSSGINQRVAYTHRRKRPYGEEWRLRFAMLRRAT